LNLLLIRLQVPKAPIVEKLHSLMEVRGLKPFHKRVRINCYMAKPGIDGTNMNEIELSDIDVSISIEVSKLIDSCS